MGLQFNFERLLEMEAEYINEIKRMQTLEHVVLFGAGATAEFNLEYLKENKIKVSAFCDNNPAKVGTSVGQTPVKSLKDILSEMPGTYFYITTQLYYNEIKEQLLSSGVPQNHISEYDVIIQLPWEQDFQKELQENFEDYRILLNELSDERSKTVLYNRLCFLITRKRSYALAIHDNIQYFDRSVWDPTDDEVFVDAGVFDGDSIKDFVRFADGKYKAVIGFETESKYAELARKNLSDYHDIEIIEKGLYEQDGEITISSSLGRMGSIEEIFEANEASEEPEMRVSVCSLDGIFRQREVKPTIIKMDIEGAEMGALKGAEMVLRNHHPKLLICVYHKRDDLLGIWKYIKKCDPAYRFYLRHYSDNSTETVLYAI